MKKIVLSVILLFAATSANAGVLISVDGVVNPAAVYMYASDTVNIGIVGDGLSQSGTYYMGLAIYSNASLDITNAGDKVYWLDWEELAGSLGILNPFLGINLMDPYFPPEPVPAGVLVENIIFHCEGVGESMLLLFDENSNLVDSQYLTEVPEPATLGMLGLGGITLLRKKR